MQKPRRGEHLSQCAVIPHRWAEDSSYRKIGRKPTHLQRKRKQDENEKWKIAVHRPHVRKEGTLSSWEEARALEPFYRACLYVSHVTCESRRGIPDDFFPAEMPQW